MLGAGAAHLFAQRWRELSDLVASLPPQSARLLVSALADESNVDLGFGNLTEFPMGHTIVAAAQVSWAWRYRGSGVASTVTPVGLAGFVAQLNAARESVAHAIAADPQDGVARALGFQVYKGLSDRIALLDGLQGYLTAARRPVGGLSVYADAISRRWLGSEEQSLSFARSVRSVDLPVSLGIIPDVHYWSWTGRLMLANATPERPVELFSEYLSRPEIRAEIITADDEFRSFALDPDACANWYANSHMSFALLQMNETERARTHLLNMGSYLGGPWADLDRPRERLNAIRHQLGLEAV